MPRYICHYAGKFFEWSTVVDAPVSSAMGAKEFCDYYAAEYGKRSLDGLSERMERAVKTGCSSMIGESLSDVISCNRAGPEESTISLSDVLNLVGISPEDVK